MRELKKKHLYLIIWFGVGIGAFSLGFKSGGDPLFAIAQQLELFSKVYKEVNTAYADEVDPTRLMQTSIDSILKSLDPYTVFVSESRIEDAKLIQTGRYSGIGANFSRHGDKVVVTQVVENGPADKAGIRVGDVLLQVDNEVVSDSSWSLTAIDNLIQGEQGAAVAVTVEQKGTPMSYSMERDYVAALEGDVSYSALVEDAIGYIKLEGFNGNAAREVKQAYDKLKEQQEDLKGLVLDVRGNPGGRVDQAIGILNLFLDQGETVLEMKGSTAQHTRSFQTPFPSVDTEIPLAVLISETSASASEIVAGTIQDLDRGIVVGTQSFGKGLVQNIRPLSYNTQFRITVAKYYTPSGRCIQAIDYGNRTSEGKLIPHEETIPNEFETRKGRKVYDGAGIAPDELVQGPETPEILKQLIRQHLIFDFVTEYARDHDSIASPKSFKVDEALFQEFLAFIQSRNFDFEPKSEQKLTQLHQDIRSGSPVWESLDRLATGLKGLKEADMDKHKAVIKKAIQQDIIRRFYYRAGLIESSFAQDEVVLKATELLKDSDRYTQLLASPKE